MAVWSILKDWGLEDKAQILCSDTNSSNTGRINTVEVSKTVCGLRDGIFSISASDYEKVLRSVFEHALPQVISSPNVVFFKKSEKNGIIWNKCLSEICSESKILNNIKYLSNALKNEKLKHD
ncbi:hypothetical protein AVEN_10940-1 [Araneus ventricosus]|uniref:Uncharacterized protein n=1 Tax=Araneus ventricosus TaxID=182803 RepID=A0A4Y2IG37_ARAVE|nr:hypothetical protein AVEN_10940-1 [Araneus ventricosus]